MVGISQRVSKNICIGSEVHKECFELGLSHWIEISDGMDFSFIKNEEGLFQA